MIWLFSTLTFVATSTTLALFLCVLLGSLTTFVAVTSLSLGLVLSVFVFFKFKDRFPPVWGFSYFNFVILLAYLVFCFRHFLWLIFVSGGSVITLDSGNFGDLPKHIAYITYLARGVHFWPDDPLLVGEPFAYYFGIDLFSALFSKLGISFLYYLPIMGMVFGVILSIAFFAWGGAWALGAFLFAGGGLQYNFFGTGILKNYQESSPWGSIILLFTTQRGFLYAIPAGLLVLWSWRRRFFSDENGPTATDKPLPPYVEGLLWGTMPFLHIHTFLFLSFLFACWFFLTKRYKSITVFAWALLPAALEMFLVTNHFGRSSLIWWKPGWMIEAPIYKNALFFFWNNYGLYVPLALTTLWFSIKTPSAWKQLLPAAVLYFVCLFVMFAPWDWDNNKLMIWCYILALPLMYELSLKPMTNSARVFAISLLFIPGIVATAAMHNPVNRGNEIYNREAVDAVCTALQNASPEARVATAQTHNHPVLICGHPVVAGYGGVLWGQGLKNTDKIQEDLKKLMMGEKDWHQLAHSLKARYLFWGPAEQSQFAGSSRPWEAEHIKIVAEGDWGKIFDLGEIQ